jgi:hypothetical protein
MSEHLHHKLSVLHQNLLHGRLPRSVHWNEVVELIAHLGEVQPQGGSEFAFVVGAHRASFRKPSAPELGIDEVSQLRRFLKDASATGSPRAEPVERSRMVVVIDHHGAHVFRSPESADPAQETSIKPYDPHHFHHHLIHRKEAHYEGERVPEETSFYEEVSKVLVPAGEIVLIGHGTGKSRAVDVLMEHLKKHHSEISRRVIAVETADLSALSEAEVEAIAKQHMSRVS